MRLRTESAGLAATLVVLGAAAARAPRELISRGPKSLTEQVAPNFYVLSGSPGVDPGHPDAAGGRIGVLVGPDGVLMVDAKYDPLTEKVLTAILKINSGPIRYPSRHPRASRPHRRQPQLRPQRDGDLRARGSARSAATAAAARVAKAIRNAASFTDPARLPMITLRAWRLGQDPLQRGDRRSASGPRGAYRWRHRGPVRDQRCHDDRRFLPGTTAIRSSIRPTAAPSRVCWKRWIW